MRDRNLQFEMDMEDAELSERDVDEVVNSDMEVTDGDLERMSNSSEEEEEEEEEVSEHTLCVFKEHESDFSIFCGRLSKNGTMAVTGSEDDLAYLWDTTTGQVILKCTGHNDSVVYTEFSHDETYLATGDMAGCIQVWEMSSKTCCWQFKIDDLFWMKWHQSANVLLAGAENGEIYMWKLPKAQCKLFQGYGMPMNIGVICPDGKTLAVGYKDGTIRVVNLKDSTVQATIPANQGHANIVTDIDCDVNNKLLISASTDGKTILSTLHNGKVICVLQDLLLEAPTRDNMEDQECQSEFHTKNWTEVVTFCKNPEFPVAASGTVNGELFIWDIPKQVLRHKIDLCIGAVSKLTWKGDTTILFVSGLDGTTRCIDAKTGTCLQVYKGHKNVVLDLHISQDEKRLLTVSDDSTARVFDISSIP